ncbi:probable E3 SUMO-protein ligase RNF212 [Triplophysa dalaica]|uniref:probable E3 SUMO-protein ligase RNF212 n=1 Tax=Triplophysa dalaica TaxID=1582913 RepID=UPI0024DF4E4E|nr:probable E3 SUMO-protein ligase RNF212 [Triplophysa dalaica]XP_056626015.1 probable E3 SUMO-protein ligase RNF212 [Triplophysa dalaica]XP_056626016.1 probable E3 SUMO-protein ligase RNF212 [Triplophysa dalaica]
MSHWICCNSCFMPSGSERQLAVSNCGHIICNVCFQRGKQGVCLICKAKCQISPLSDKSSSEVQALFSDLNTVAVKCFSEISKVLQFQTRHQKRLLAHYQQKVERMQETGLKMQQEMQQEMQRMSKKITEQKAYILKLEMTLQHQSSRLTSQANLHSASHLSTTSPVTNIPYSSPLSKSRKLSASSLAEGIEINTRGLSHKPGTSGRISLISSQQDGRIGSVPHRASSQSTMGSHSVPFSATVSREFSSGLRDPVMSPSHNMAYRRESPWETPVFKLPSAYKYPSVSSLGPPP